ncbi:EVE domain-containing protein [Burkholderia vietnamiensis]|uniref:EVE domain-containing protein n=1 Tax=Burkholderia vietnamiensis TaxID=60552 RepID=UPI0009BD0BB8|nr:EVE domain-containing protein [Burkholderia vietnamiensis]
MNTWIFQGNPSIFDLDGYLQTTPGVITWLVTRNATDINVGDTVYLWRSQGNEKTEKRSGIVASAEIVSQVSTMVAEPDSHPFWLKKDNLDNAQPRVWLKVNRVANKKEELKREWLADDECLRNMLIIKQPAGTNFRLTTQEGERLRKMWLRVGQHWSRNESLAGLWAYVETFEKEVSGLPSSPVGTVSKLTGRAVNGVYNKVMNFRSIDPRDTRKGMSGASAIDRVVWDEFFDKSKMSLNDKAVRAEFDRIWGLEPLDVAETAIEDTVERESLSGEVEKLLNRSLDELLAAYSRQQKTSKPGVTNKPRTRTGRTTIFERNALVVAIARARATNRCEAPGCSYPLFEDQSGHPYCEVHHIIPLSEGGVDRIENVVCLCPTHHKEAHFGKRAGDLREQFHQIRAELLS